jgi:hypothetical protein
VKWSATSPGRFISEEKASSVLEQEAGYAQEVERSISAPGWELSFNEPVVQMYPGYYINYDTPAQPSSHTSLL